MSRLVVALALLAGLESSPALALATNPSERPAHADQEQQVNRTFAPEQPRFRNWRWKQLRQEETP